MGINLMDTGINETLNNKPHWTTKDLAKASGYTRARITQLIHEGTITGTKIGRDWVIRRDNGMAWLQSLKACYR